MGNQQTEWQNDSQILGMFAKTKVRARRKYRQFAEKGIDAGRRPDLVGGGLIRSVLGFLAVRELGITATELSRQMELIPPAISISIKRGTIESTRLRANNCVFYGIDYVNPQSGWQCRN